MTNEAKMITGAHEEVNMPQSNEGGSVTLHCLSGQTADAGLVSRWRRILDMPVAARDQIWNALRPIMLGASESEIRDVVMQLASAHELAPESLTMALQACHVVLQKASELNLDVENVREDLIALSNGHQQCKSACDALLQQYDQAKFEMRRGFGHESVLSHGKLATRCEWRVDKILSSNHGLELDIAIPVLTVNYREGEREDRITLQLSNDVVEQLRLLCDAMAGKI